MPADANLVEKAVDAVKKMQELKVEKSYFDFVLRFIKTPTNNPFPQTLQDANDKTATLKKQIDGLIALYNKIDTSVFVKFPEFWLVKISELATRHHYLLTQPGLSYVPDMDYDEITKPIRDSHHDFFQVVSLIGAMGMLGDDSGKSKDAEQILNKKIEKLDALEDSMTKKHESWEVENLKLKKGIVKLTKKAFDVLDLVRGVSGEAGAYKHAAFFEKQAKKHEIKQIIWLIVSGFITAGMLFALYDNLPSLPDVWETKTILQTLTKALVFSVMLSVLNFCIKNYRAHQHNYVVNTHRANSLRTYRAIVEGATSPDAQDIILANAAQHIFTPIDTGYVKGADSVGNPTVEVIRSVVKSGDEIKNVVKSDNEKG